MNKSGRIQNTSRLLDLNIGLADLRPRMWRTAGLSNMCNVMVGFCGPGRSHKREMYCAVGYAKCPASNRCVSELWLCDGDDDCGDNSDEDRAFCGTLSPVSNCLSLFSVRFLACFPQSWTRIGFIYWLDWIWSDNCRLFLILSPGENS